MKYYAPITDYVVRSTYIRTLFFSPVHLTNNQNTSIVRFVFNGYDNAVMPFLIPSEANMLLEAKLIIWNNFGTGQQDIRYDMRFEQSGEQRNTHSNNGVLYFSIPEGIPYAKHIDLPSYFLDNANAGDAGGVRIFDDGARQGFDFYLRGFYIKFSV